MPLKKDGTLSQASQRAGQKIFITYPRRGGYDSALQTIHDYWDGRWKGATLESVVRVIVLFAPHKVFL